MTAVRRAREIVRFEREVDVLVMGLGMAGACAALEAKAAGAEVLVLERSGAGGGASALSGGLVYMGGGTPVQQAAGFEDSEENMYRFLMAVSQPGADEEKIRVFCEGSVEHFHWFEKQGVPFKRSFYDEPGLESRTDDCLVYSAGEDCAPWNRIAVPAPRGHKAQVVQKGGGLLMKCMLEAVGREAIAVLTDTRVEALIVGDDGVVEGAVARHAGRELAFRARRGVVLAAGGFIMNREMCRLHAPVLDHVTDRNGTPGDDGAGIRLGQAAGGSAIRMHLGEVALPYTIPNALAKGVYLNARGQRFINEDTYHGHVGIAGLYRENGELYLLLDDATFRRGLVGLQPGWVAETFEELEAEVGFPRARSSRRWRSTTATPRPASTPSSASGASGSCRS